ncbi:siderophore-interacting protein [Kitasatospora sp. NPDC059327]|uniref:siderophore-interacting protein n=1 Tax=Kitasatospora sp. NPDC059327 TaxID=3346803 RepID=UPI0036B71A2F
MFRRPRPTHDVEVIATTPLTSTLTRITLAGPTLSELGIEHPTQWVKLTIPEGASRAYTIRHHRPAEREVDIDVVLHGNGPAARWASVARPGDRARLAGPRGRRPDFGDAADLLLAADESALPAALTVLDGLPATVRVFAYFEVATAADALPLASRAGLTTAWLPRDEPRDDPRGSRRDDPRPKGRLLADTLLAADVPAGAAAWIAGEATAVATVRRHLLTDRALPRDRVHAKGYWKHGEADHKD